MIFKDTKITFVIQCLCVYLWEKKKKAKEKINLNTKDTFNISLPQAHHYLYGIADLEKLSCQQKKVI